MTAADPPVSVWGVCGLFQNSRTHQHRAVRLSKHHVESGTPPPPHVSPIAEGSRSSWVSIVREQRLYHEINNTYISIHHFMVSDRQFPFMSYMTSLPVYLPVITWPRPPGYTCASFSRVHWCPSSISWCAVMARM